MDDESLVIPPSSRAARWSYACAIPGVIGLVTAHAATLVMEMSLASVPLVIVALLLGALLADLVTAAVHWACDTWGSSRTPYLGAGLIHAFRVHHRRPRAMLEHDWLDVNGGASAAIFALLLVLTASGLLPLTGGEDAGWLRALVLGFSLVAAPANQLHYWAHAVRAPSWVRALQRRGVVLSAAAHGPHHRAPHTCGYCISLGWLNRPLDAIEFWRRLERGLSRLTGARPRGEPGAVRAADEVAAFRESQELK